MNKDAEKRLKFLDKELRKLGLEFRPESYNWSVIQGLLWKGDRRLSRLLELVRHYGDIWEVIGGRLKKVRGTVAGDGFLCFSRVGIGSSFALESFKRAASRSDFEEAFG